MQNDVLRFFVLLEKMSDGMHVSLKNAQVELSFYRFWCVEKKLSDGQCPLEIGTKSWFGTVLLCSDARPVLPCSDATFSDEFSLESR